MSDHDPEYPSESQDQTDDSNETISHRPLTTEEVAAELEQGNAEFIMHRDMMFDDEKAPIS